MDIGVGYTLLKQLRSASIEVLSWILDILNPTKQQNPLSLKFLQKYFFNSTKQQSLKFFMHHLKLDDFGTPWNFKVIRGRLLSMYDKGL